MTGQKTDPMDAAFEQARLAETEGEVPIGAVIVDGTSGEIIARAGNRTETNNDPAGHAEIIALRDAARRRRSPRLGDCDLYVTLEPCPMCAQAISLARIRRLYFAAYDPKGGGVDHGPRIYDQTTCHHRPEVVGGLRERQAADLLQAFFRSRR